MGRDKGCYTYYKFYISPFSQEDVQEFLHNKYNNTYYILFTHLKDTIIFIMLYNFELEKIFDVPNIKGKIKSYLLKKEDYLKSIKK